jgi:hypothetical protein
MGDSLRGDADKDVNCHKEFVNGAVFSLTCHLNGKYKWLTTMQQLPECCCCLWAVCVSSHLSFLSRAEHSVVSCSSSGIHRHPTIIMKTSSLLRSSQTAHDNPLSRPTQRIRCTHIFLRLFFSSFPGAHTALASPSPSTVLSVHFRVIRRVFWRHGDRFRVVVMTVACFSATSRRRLILPCERGL